MRKKSIKQQNSSGIQHNENRVEVNESGNRNLQNEEIQEGRLVDIQTPNLQHEGFREQMMTRRIKQRTTPQPQEPRRVQQPDTSISRTVGGSQTEQREKGTGAGHSLTNTSTCRRVEGSRDQEAQNPGTQNGDEHAESQSEEQFRTLRSFHEKQHMGRQGENPQHPSVSSHSTLEGAVGGNEPDNPKPQRTNKRTRQNNVGNPIQNQVPYQVQKEREEPQPDSYFQGMHNATMYMNLPNSIQNKICGRCGLVGHIKKQCREDVYCKFCRNPSHSIKACRTYANFMRMDPITSSRKNTPEKCTTEDIDREIMRRVQQEMKRILNDLEMNRLVDEGWKMNQGFTSKQQIKQNRSTHQQVPANTNGIHNLIGDYQRPPEVPENTGNVQNRKNMGQQPVEAYPILNQQWEDPTTHARHQWPP